MPTIAIVGAGPSLGLSIAKIFGSHGFTVALISRNESKLDHLVRELASQGITSAAFPADVSNHPQLEQALQAAKKHFGQIDVLEYSPLANFGFTYASDTTLDTLRPQVESLLYGAVTSVQAVLPDMLEAHAGTILLTTGGGAVNPYPMLATTNIAQAGIRNWAYNLHNSLRDEGIYVANIAINLMITTRPPAGVRYMEPDAIALNYWDMYTKRSEAERLIQ
jgi:NADP-dependent 3-hydroxy acid dehydrogenase YdfG